MRELVGDHPSQQRFLDEMRAELERHQPGIAQHLPDEEVWGMKRYTGMDHQYWNEALRHGNLDAMARHDSEIKCAVSGMNRLPDWAGTPEHPLVYRGIQIDSVEELDKLLHRYQPGSTVEERAFTSASKDSPFPGDVQFVIKPHHAKDLEWLNPTGGMKEVAWSPGNRFEILSRSYKPETGTWIIHLLDHGR